MTRGTISEAPENSHEAIHRPTNTASGAAQDSISSRLANTRASPPSESSTNKTETAAHHVRHFFPFQKEKGNGVPSVANFSRSRIGGLLLFHLAGTRRKHAGPCLLLKRTPLQSPDSPAPRTWCPKELLLSVKKKSTGFS